jgi:hypothetical protein
MCSSSRLRLIHAPARCADVLVLCPHRAFVAAASCSSPPPSGLSPSTTRQLLFLRQSHILLLVPLSITPVTSWPVAAFSLVSIIDAPQVFDVMSQPILNSVFDQISAKFFYSQLSIPRVVPLPSISCLFHMRLLGSKPSPFYFLSEMLAAT